MLKNLTLAAALASSACVSAPPPACALPETDRAWVDRSLEAWRFASRDITGIGQVPGFQAIFFSADCVLRSGNALSSPTAQGVTWTASPHGGSIALPDGSEIPTGVTSFASGKKGLTYFVMSTPTVWQAAGVGEGPALETLMVAVLLHEASHVAQIGPYGPRLGALIERYNLPDSFNDNAVQERFRENAEFAASVKQETQLFVDAAAAKDDVQAKSLARATLLGGQVFQRKPSQSQFARLTHRLRSWEMHQELPRLETTFFQTRVTSPKQLQASVQLLAIFAKFLAEDVNRDLLAAHAHDRLYINIAKNFIFAHASEPLHLRDVAAHVHVSTNYFSKFFKKATGIGFSAFLTRVRVENAKNKLANPVLTINEVAHEVGFGSLSQFNRAFHRYVGCSPREFRASLSQAHSL